MSELIKPIVDRLMSLNCSQDFITILNSINDGYTTEQAISELRDCNSKDGIGEAKPKGSITVTLSKL